jgi:hypothetical protein
MDGLTPPWDRITLVTLVLIGVSLLAPIPSSAQVSATFSFYVPQAGPVAAPLEGASAPKSFSFFRACPNNDGNGSLPNSARIKVVAKDVLNNPMVGISADSICALFSEADSIIAGTPCDSCPIVRCLSADAPTDINGVTYITFTGANPASPGVGVRDPNRKWGHYDSKIPVRIKGVEIFGRLTTGSLPNTYSLVIRTFDVVGGFAFPCIPGEAESVDAADWSAFLWCLGGGFCPMFYQLDFNWDGMLTAPDVNVFVNHFGHNCTNPFNP